MQWSTTTRYRTLSRPYEVLIVQCDTGCLLVLSKCPGVAVACCLISNDKKGHLIWVFAQQNAKKNIIMMVCIFF